MKIGTSAIGFLFLEATCVAFHQSLYFSKFAAEKSKLSTSHLASAFSQNSRIHQVSTFRTSKTHFFCTAEQVSANSEKRQLEKTELVNKLKEEAALAAKEAEEAEKRARFVKESEKNQYLLQAARRYKLEKESEKIKTESTQRAAEARRLAVAAVDAERNRGTTTLAQRLGDESRAAAADAHDAERRAEDLARRAGAAVPEVPPSVSAEHIGRAGVVEPAGPPLRYEDVIAELKSVRLVPKSGVWSDISAELLLLDNLKQQGKLHLWDSLDHHSSFSANGYQRPKSLEQLVRVCGVEAEEVDSVLGVGAYKALKLKNRVLGAVMLCAGTSLLVAGLFDGPGGSSPLGTALVAFGYGALVTNLMISFFGQSTNDFVSRRLFTSNFEGFRDRVVACEAGHLLMAWICGLPVQDYRREFVGYPNPDRPTGRAMIFSSRRGDPDIKPRSRPLGLPAWTSLQRETAAGTPFDIADSEPLRNGYSTREIDALSLVLMAGPVAEWLQYGESTNGALLYQQLDTCMMMSQVRMGGDEMQGQARYGIIRATAILRENRRRLKALCDAMRREASLAECIAMLESTPSG